MSTLKIGNNMEIPGLKDTNKVELIGRLEAPFQFSHCVKEKKYYSTTVLVRRATGKNSDRIPVCIDEKMKNELPSSIYDAKVNVKGYIVTARKDDGKLVISVRISTIIPEEESSRDMNFVELSGALAKEPLFRVTLSGDQITDMYIITERAYGRTSYIPAIAWYGNAYFAKELHKTAKVFVKALFQSRKYQKVYADGSCEEKETYELSVFYLRKEADKTNIE